MGEKEWSPSSIFDIFGDSLARNILVLASDRPVSAEYLDKHLDVSPPTIYRRANALVEYELLKEHHQVDTDGNHYKTFETTLKRISFEIENSGYDIDIQMKQSLVDQFEAFWADLEHAHSERRFETNEPTGNDRIQDDPSHG